MTYEETLRKFRVSTDLDVIRIIKDNELHCPLCKKKSLWYPEFIDRNCDVDGATHWCDHCDRTIQIRIIT